MFPLSRLFNLNWGFVSSLRQHSQYKTKLYMKTMQLESKDKLDDLIKRIAPRLIYNTIIEKKLIPLQNHLQKDYKVKKVKTKPEEPLPLTLKYLSDDIHVSEPTPQASPEADKVINFPYSSGGHNVQTSQETTESQTNSHDPDIAAVANQEVQKRYEIHKDMKNWMVSYDNYDDSCLNEEYDLDTSEWNVNYGTPDPKSKISNIPCGGCGALLHCKDTAIPGYIPSEIFKNNMDGGANLAAIVCQRCHFLKYYNVALQVQVTPDDYPKVLSTVSQRQGLVILMVDLLDFPCSIWPGIGEIFGNRVPIVVVGNKVDLLAQDSADFLKHVRMTLLNCVKLQGFATFNIKDVALISAKTGYGVEDLITKLHSLKIYGGDVYIVGCTNVGKSSLFNVFLQSDYCKNQAMDLIQRATTSVWPGTTLNLLKFPIKRPEGYRQYLRHKRLQLLQKIEAEERQFRKEQLKITKNPKYASLVGHIDVTKNPYSYRKRGQEEVADSFIVKGSQNDRGITTMGINEKSKTFIDSRWCYDTPGVVQPDQIIHLLTTDELLLTLPKELILPRTFCVKPNSSLFIGGLSRLDYLDGFGSVRLTVFASNELPITVCETEEAGALYEELLGTDLLKVPTGGDERLAKWPGLEMAKEFAITGVNWRQSANDIVLSSSGWIALTGKEGHKYSFRAWTPEKRGAYVRDCLLPHAVALTGKRIRNSVAYSKYKFFLR